MATRTHRYAILAGFLVICSPLLRAQVFVVGEKTATADISTAFKPTSVLLPTDKLTERGKREIVRNLEAEQGFAHRSLPIGVITLTANGDLGPEPDKYRQMIYQKGQAAGPGDRVIITALDIKNDRIVIDLNGGPYAKHRFLSHVSFGNSPVAGDSGPQATGSRVTLIFPKGVPEISGPEIKALLEPVVDFGVKTGDQAYADTLPSRLRDAVAAHEVLVGMNHRMVLASLGAPESKVREQQSGDPNGARYEEWIYGHVPQTVKFIRFVGDHVTVVEIAALGKPVEIHDKNELDGSELPTNTREIAMGDRQSTPGEEGSAAPPPPTLRQPGEAAPANAQGRVQYPPDKSASRSADRQPIPAAPGSAADTTADSQLPSQTTTLPSASQSSPIGTQPNTSTRPR